MSTEHIPDTDSTADAELLSDELRETLDTADAGILPSVPHLFSDMDAVSDAADAGILPSVPHLFSDIDVVSTADTVSPATRQTVFDWVPNTGNTSVFIAPTVTEYVSSDSYNGDDPVDILISRLNRDSRLRSQDMTQKERTL